MCCTAICTYEQAKYQGTFRLLHDGELNYSTLALDSLLSMCNYSVAEKRLMHPYSKYSVAYA